MVSGDVEGFLNVSFTHRRHSQARGFGILQYAFSSEAYEL
jgi:hypothetical protein